MHSHHRVPGLVMVQALDDQTEGDRIIDLINSKFAT
jgi:hypothetical protein